MSSENVLGRVRGDLLEESGNVRVFSFETTLPRLWRVLQPQTKIFSPLPICVVLFVSDKSLALATLCF